MPLDKLKTRGKSSDETLFTLRDPEGRYTHSEVCDIVENAERLGIPLELGSEFNGMTVHDFAAMLRIRQ